MKIWRNMDGEIIVPECDTCKAFEVLADGWSKRYRVKSRHMAELSAEVEKLTDAIYTLCENDCNAIDDDTVRELVKARGCGGEHHDTMNGEEFDCAHDYAWDCDSCPMQEIFHPERAAKAGKEE